MDLDTDSREGFQAMDNEVDARPDRMLDEVGYIAPTSRSPDPEPGHGCWYAQPRIDSAHWVTGSLTGENSVIEHDEPANADGQNKPSADPSEQVQEIDPSVNSPISNMPSAEEEATEKLDDSSQALTIDPGSWKLLARFDIPDYTQTHLSKIPQFQTVYQSYRSSYDDPVATNTTRMITAKTLSYILLKHYYPSSLGYTVEECSLGPSAKNGIGFMLRPPGPEMSTLAARNKVGKKPTPFNESAYINKNHTTMDWSWIKPEDIAGFVVTRRVQVRDEQTGNVTIQTRPYTYLAILFDDLSSEPRHMKSNTLHRSDVLADALLRTAGLEQSHATLVYGPRMEFYAFSAGEEWIWYESENDDKAAGKKKTARKNKAATPVQTDIEPRLELLNDGSGGEDSVVDMQTMGILHVDERMKGCLAREVKWADGVSVNGIRVSDLLPTAEHQIEEEEGQGGGENNAEENMSMPD